MTLGLQYREVLKSETKNRIRFRLSLDLRYLISIFLEMIKRRTMGKMSIELRATIWMWRIHKFYKKNCNKAKKTLSCINQTETISQRWQNQTLPYKKHNKHRKKFLFSIKQAITQMGVISQHWRNQPLIFNKYSHQIKRILFQINQTETIIQWRRNQLQFNKKHNN